MIRVLVVIEIPLRGDVIETIISNSGNMTVVNRATTITESLKYIEDCDVVLLSATLTGNGIFELIQKIAVEYPKVKTLVIGLPESAPLILSFLEAGASGYVLQTEPSKVLLEKIQAAYDHQPIISPEIVAALISRVAELARFQRNASESE